MRESMPMMTEQLSPTLTEELLELRLLALPATLEGPTTSAMSECMSVISRSGRPSLL